MSDAPKSLIDLLQRYAKGERHFEGCDFEETAKFDGATLAGAVFDDSWFSDADFRSCDLRGTSFARCNVKCADFQYADLSGASFREASVEAANFEGATLNQTSFDGAGYYGVTLSDDMDFPHDKNKEKAEQDAALKNQRKSE